MLPVAAVAGALVGKPAPGFALHDQTGASCALADVAGQPVLLKIGTTWCPSCAGQSAEIIRALPELQELGVTVIEVFVEDTAEAVETYRAAHHLPAEVRTCLDEQSQVLAAYRVTGIPRVLMLDPGHVVVKEAYLVPAGAMVKAFREMGGN